MKVAIVGNGNVASHLFQALRDKVETVLINSRTLEGFPPDADIVLISVSDNAIEEVFSRLPHTAAVMAHTAGSVPMEVLSKNRAGYGVFYPLQTFTKGLELNYRDIPVFIEGNSQETVERLKALASLFSDNVKEADSEARKKLHLASVFACNFSNALAGISQEILKESALDFKDLLPLMKQTINKLASLSATEAQTGPAVRGDTKVMNAHLKMLEDKPLFQEIYTLLSDYISDTKKKERL